MSISKCQACKHLHASANDGGVSVKLEETRLVIRGTSRFYECPDCGRLYAVSLFRHGETPLYSVVSSVSLNAPCSWISPKFKSRNFIRKYPVAVKTPLRLVYTSE